AGGRAGAAPSASRPFGLCASWLSASLGMLRLPLGRSLAGAGVPPIFSNRHVHAMSRRPPSLPLPVLRVPPTCSKRPQAMPIIPRLARPAAHRRPPGSPGWGSRDRPAAASSGWGSRHGPAAGPPGPGPPAAIADIAITGTVTNGGMSADPGFNVERPEPGSPTVLGFNPPALRRTLEGAASPTPRSVIKVVKHDA